MRESDFLGLRAFERELGAEEDSRSCARAATLYFERHRCRLPRTTPPST